MVSDLHCDQRLCPPTPTSFGLISHMCSPQEISCTSNSVLTSACWRPSTDTPNDLSKINTYIHMFKFTAEPWPKNFPGSASGKESTCQCRRHKRCGFDPWAGKICWRRAWQPTPVFLPGESQGQRSLARPLQFMGLHRVGHD